MPDALVGNILNLAKKIHEDYQSKKDEKDVHEYSDWDSLTDDIKNSNIRQAMMIPVKLEAIGCYIGDKDDPGETVTEFNEDEILVLSMKEHELWVEEREESGWTYGPEKIIDEMISPCIAPWEDLSPEDQQLDIDTTMNIIPLLGSIGLRVCRPKENDEVLKDFNYSKETRAPIIISVSGHRDVSDDYVRNLEERTSQLIDSFRDRYPDTPIIVMSGLAEGADRIVAKVALEKGINLAPVFPKKESLYVETFTGLGYQSREESLSDFQNIMENTLTYSPCVLCSDKVNNVFAYRVLAGYLVTNSHVIIAAWDGRRYGVKGGTYDVIRMALNGADPDIADRINPMTSVSAKAVMSPSRYLDTSDNALVYWVETGRDSGASALEKSMCRDIDRKAERYCGFIGKGEPGERKQSFIDKVFYKLEERKRSPVFDTHSEKPSKTLIEDIDITPRLTTSVPDEYDRQFLRMAEFNDDLNKGKVSGSYEKDGCGLLASGDECTRIVREKGCMREMAERYDRTRAASDYYRARSRFMTVMLIVITAVCSFFFYSLMLFTGSLILTALYMLMNIFVIVLVTIHMGNREHRKHLEYHALAESLSTQFYWSILGINEEVSRNFNGYQKSGMMWAGAIIRGYSSYFMNDYSKSNAVGIDDRIGCAKESWVRMQRKFHDGDSKDKSVKDRLVDRIISTLGATSVLISLLAFIIVVFVLDYFDDALFSTPIIDIGGHSISSGFEVDGYALVKLLMILVTVLITATMSVKNMILRESEGAVAAKRSLLTLALNKLDIKTKTNKRKIIQTKLGIFYELGVQLTNDSNDWVIRFAEKDFKKQQGLIKVSGLDNTDEIKPE